jgi:hypothetical protein
MEYFVDIWDFLWPFGTFCVHLVHFFPVLVSWTKKNLASLVVNPSSITPLSCTIAREVLVQATALADQRDTRGRVANQLQLVKKSILRQATTSPWRLGLGSGIVAACHRGDWSFGSWDRIPQGGW